MPDHCGSWRGVAGVILAGGLSRRFRGQRKPFLMLRGKPLVQHAAERARPQVAALWLSVAKPATAYAATGLPVVCDHDAGRYGPAGGVLASLEAVRRVRPDLAHVMTFAVDAPFFPLDLVARLAKAADGVAPVCVTYEGQLQPTFALWPVMLAEPLREAMEGGGPRALHRLLDLFEARAVPYPRRPADPFFNVNRPADLALAGRRLSPPRPGPAP